MTLKCSSVINIGLCLLFTLVQTVFGQEECKGITAGIVASFTNCAQYYDCGAPDKFKECRYTQLFDRKTRTCVQYKLVDCGERTEPVDPCDYVMNTCAYARGHCRPCSVNYPSCVSKPDGLNIWEGKANSPYYVLCKDGRIVNDGFCDQSAGTSIFDGELRKCVPYL